MRQKKTEFQGGNGLSMLNEINTGKRPIELAIGYHW